MSPAADACARDFAAGEPAAVREVTRWAQLAARGFRSRLGDDWADAVRDALAEVLRDVREDRYRGESAFKSSVWRAVAHTCIDRLRARQRRHRSEVEGADDALEPAAPTAPFAAHPPVETLLAWAEGEVAESSQEVALHLAGCPECREQAALAEAGRLDLAEAPVSAPRRRRAAWWTAAALIVVTAGLLWTALRRPGTDSTQRLATLSQRVDRLESEAGRLQEGLQSARDLAARTGAELQSARQRLTDLAGVRTDVRVLELLPEVRTEHGNSAPAAPLVSADHLLSLLLVREDTRSFAGYRLAVADPAGTTLQHLTGLTSQPDGDVALVIPAGELGTGQLRLTLEGDAGGGRWATVGRYRLEVEPAAPESPGH